MLEIHCDAEIWHELEIRSYEAASCCLSEMHVKSGRKGHASVRYAGRRHDEGAESLEGKIICGSGADFYKWSEPAVSEGISGIKITSQKKTALELFLAVVLHIYDFIVADSWFCRNRVIEHPWIKARLKRRTTSDEPSVAEVVSMCCGETSIWILLGDYAEFDIAAVTFSVES